MPDSVPRLPTSVPARSRFKALCMPESGPVVPIEPVKTPPVKGRADGRWYYEEGCVSDQRQDLGIDSEQRTSVIAASMSAPASAAPQILRSTHL